MYSYWKIETNKLYLVMFMTINDFFSKSKGYNSVKNQ
jgi:hypothetical protein